MCIRDRCIVEVLNGYKAKLENLLINVNTAGVKNIGPEDITPCNVFVVQPHRKQQITVIINIGTVLVYFKIYKL